MTTIELAAAAEKAMDALTTRLNDQPSDSPEVVEKLKGIVHGVLLALGAALPEDAGDTAEQAREVMDTLLQPAVGALDDLAEALRDDEYQRTIAA
ncbi:hypothetical protein [Nonomuraea wenchangensis]|uniref:Uncharacterized protein n=1 Tax=Nonomuraea wenchangensis TaxID=568860 RepID=A0A1I0F094_9ACTN|nr:hypothetical protein [Nonomuraea wenchangensis]SET50631.1 hypothetical protein SAMN05421811_103255 [Nonomuraea wenchangensis]